MYAVSIAIVALVFLYAGYATFFTAAPTCSDGRQNQGERGVDCGGPCSLACAADVHPATLLWARAFEVRAPATSTQAGTYTAAAYIQSNNVSYVARHVPYSFQLFDDKNILLVERTGYIDFPPQKTIPIVETNIDTGTRTVARALFAFGATPVWEIPSHAVPQLRASNINRAADGSSLTATLINDGVADVTYVTVVGVLFDKDGVARAASKSIVSVAHKSSQVVTFTWPQGTPDIVRAEVSILPPI